MTTSLRIAFVPGVTITKWSRIWEERRRDTPLTFVPTLEAEQSAVLHAGDADLSFVRLPVAAEGLSVIRLYDEIAVVVLSADDPLADGLADDHEFTLAELDGLTLHDPDVPVADSIALIAAGVGAVILPHSIARAHSRKDLVSRPVRDAPPTEIAITWIAENTTPDIEEFVGIVRGRSARSSRAVPTPPTEKPVSSKTAAPAKGGGAAAKKAAGGKAVAKRKPYATSGGSEAKNRSGSPNSPKARNARKRKGR
ncbi:MAG: LysR substrate-binding domain-containing protein [Microbacteriaceae bacterium]